MHGLIVELHISWAVWSTDKKSDKNRIFSSAPIFRAVPNKKKAIYRGRVIKVRQFDWLDGS